MEGVTQDDHKRFEELFSKLDVNKDGKIEIGELTSALAAARNVSDADQHAQVII